MGYKKDSVRKGGRWFSLRASHPLFSLQSISLFLPDCPASFLFLYTLLTFWCQNLGGKIHRNWVGFSYGPTSGGPLPWTLWRNRRALGWDSPLALLDWHPYTSPHFIHQLQGWVKSHSLRSSLSHPFQVLGLGRRIPMALQPLALCPIWLWNRGCPFQSRLLLLSEKVLRTGTPFLSDLSSCFLLPLSNLPFWPQWEILNPSPQNLLL